MVKVHELYKNYIIMLKTYTDLFKKKEEINLHVLFNEFAILVGLELKGGLSMLN